MRSLLAILPAAAVLALAATGCGDTCASKGAPLEAAATPGCTNIGSAGANVTAPLCQRCTDTSPSCQVEVRPGNVIEIDATLKECDSNKGCGDPSCATPRPQVSCAVPQLSAGAYRIQFIGANGQLGGYDVTVVPGGPTSCTL